MAARQLREPRNGQRRSLLLSPSDVLYRGIGLLKIYVSKYSSHEWKIRKFEQHYGSSPRCIAAMWYDLCTNEASKLEDKDVNESGFRMMMVAQNWLWDLPKNAGTFATRWQQCERYCRGKPIWDWVEKIASLVSHKIKWDTRMDEADSEIFVLSSDGTDYRTREKSSNGLNKDPKNCSYKSRHCAVRYEIAISVRTGMPVWLNGPFRGAAGEKTIYKEGLAKKVKDGKLVITDGGMVGCPHVSIPCLSEPKEVRRFKALVRCRHESYNGRLKNFGILEQTFKFDLNKHIHAFNAVCVIMQYQLELGKPLYDLYLQPY